MALHLLGECLELVLQRCSSQFDLVLGVATCSVGSDEDPLKVFDYWYVSFTRRARRKHAEDEA